MGNKAINNYTFHNATTTVGNGTAYNVIGYEDTIKLQFITSGTFTAIIEAKLIDDTAWYPYDVYKIPDYSLVTSGITDKNYLYEVDVTGITALRVRLSAVSGALSVYGKVVG